MAELLELELSSYCPVPAEIQGYRSSLQVAGVQIVANNFDEYAFSSRVFAYCWEYFLGERKFNFLLRYRPRSIGESVEKMVVTLGMVC